MTPRKNIARKPAAAKTPTGKSAKKIVQKTSTRGGVKVSSTAAKRASTASRVATRRSPGAAAAGQAHPHPAVAYRLHALLHTMHSIEHQEEQLCTLLTEIERTGKVVPALRRELETLLDELPSQALLADLHAARQALK